MKVAIVTDVRTPYRDALFDSIATKLGPNFRVFLWSARHPRRQWTLGDASYDRTVLSDRVLAIGERSLHIVRGASAAIADWRPDIVIIAGWEQPASWAVRRWCLKSGTVAVAWVESHSSSGSQRGPLSNMVRRRFLHGFKAAIVPGKEASDFLAALGFVGPSLDFPNTVVPPRPLAQANPRTGVTLLFLGSLSARKNPDRVLDIARSAKGNGETVRVVFAGSGELGDTIASHADSQNIDVTMAGYIEGESLERLWSSVDCLIVPSLSDPAPLVLSEAAARGVPFIASTNCGGAQTLIGLGACGAVMSLDDSNNRWWEATRTAMREKRLPLRAVLPDVAAGRLVEFLEMQATITGPNAK